MTLHANMPNPQKRVLKFFSPLKKTRTHHHTLLTPRDTAVNINRLEQPKFRDLTQYTFGRREGHQITKGLPQGWRTE